MIPFFVLDRPISLEILKGFFAENLDYKFGILTHAFTSKNFQKKFKEFPFSTPLKYSALSDDYNINKKIHSQIIKFVDSGIFQANRNVSYEELFNIYDYMEADYGIIIDFLKDREKTIESAKKALKVYKKGKYKFKLVGVAQGKDIDNYLKCYEQLKELGFEYIALGGLLRRNGNSNYIRLSCEIFLIELLEKLNKNFDLDWIFTLGIYNPDRHKLLEDYGVWGADYKGWLFEYEENYSFILDKIDKYKISKIRKKRIVRALKAYIGVKELIKLNSTEFDKDELMEKAQRIRKILDNLLKREKLSLQEFRFRRVRENLNKKIIEKNLIKIPSNSNDKRNTASTCNYKE